MTGPGNDLALIPVDASEIERSADPAVYVIAACERAKTWLAHALEHGGIEQIVELKSQAEAIRVYTMSKQLGQDAQLAAAEIVRRAERGIGQAIRKGQEAGELYIRGGNRRGNNKGTEETFEPPKVSELFRRPQERADTYAMTDGVSDEQFEGALAEAKAEGNLSRANVVRKVRRPEQDEPVATPSRDNSGEWIPDADNRSAEAAVQRRKLIRQMAAEGYTSHQISDRIGTLDGTIREIARRSGIDIHADRVLGKNVRQIDSNRIVRETVHALSGLAMGVGLIDYSALDLDEIDNWVASLTTSTRAINRMTKEIRKLKEATQ